MRLLVRQRFLCTALLVLFLHAGEKSFAQTSERITLTLEKASLQKIFSAIESQSSYRFVYTGEQLKDAIPVSLSVNKMMIEEVLHICFQDQPVNYSIEDHFIIIHRNNKQKKETDPAPDHKIISGTARNEKGDPLSGVTVTVSQTGKGTSTGPDGSFSLENVPDNATLVFSGTNVESYQMKVHNQRSILISLKTKTSNLDDVQIIAYGTTTRRLNTGDVSTVSAQTIAEQPISNPLEALEGRSPGLVVTQQTGITGGGFFVQIRGQNSISNGNNPLYIVDGISYPSVPLSDGQASSGTISGGSPLSSINPSDIESISILKDADATAIYGSRGANGVVLITTKKGKAGSTKTDAGFYIGAGHITREIDLLNTPQYLQMRNEAFTNDGEIPTVATAPDLLVWDTTRYTNWEKTLIGGTSQILDGQLSVSGGSSNTQFLFGLGYHQESTVFPGDFGSKRFSGNLNLNHTSQDQKLKISVIASYSSFDINLFDLDLTMAALTTAPDSPPVLDSNGKLNWDGGTFNNPYAALLQAYTGNTGNLISNASISYQIDPHFQMKLNGGYNEIQESEILSNPVTAFNPRFGYYFWD